MSPVPHSQEPRDRAAVLLGLRGVYFFALGAAGAFLPFWPLLLANRGLRPTEVATVMAIVPVLGILVPPVWGVLADALDARASMLRLSALATAVGVLSFLVDGGFVGSIVAMVVMWLFRAPLVSMADAATHAELGTRHHDFARIRIFGAIGFACVSFSAGLVAPNRPVVLVGLVSLLHLLAAASTMPLRSSVLHSTVDRGATRVDSHREGRSADGPPPRRSSPIGVVAVLRGLWGASTSPFLLLFLGTTLHYSAHGAFDVLFGLHARALGLGGGFVGIGWTLAVMAEIVLMYFAPRLLRAAPALRLVVVATITASVRWFLLSKLTSPTAILMTQPLHGVTFGLWYLSMVKYVQERSPEGLRTSIQAAAFSSMSLGKILGLLVGGRLFESGGGALLFETAAVMSLLGAAAYSGLWFFERRRGFVSLESRSLRGSSGSG